MKNVVVLSGAGISAESGLKTFRDADGLWEGHDVMEVASPEGWRNNPELVLDFYNQRRSQLKEVHPNQAHLDLVTLEHKYRVDIITQNVDDLHERAGSTHVLHLHGELKKARSINGTEDIVVWEDDIKLGQKATDGYQMRPHIVWFGEAVPMIEESIPIVEHADVIIIVGTSMQVYPAAGLISYARSGVPIYYIDPYPSVSYELRQSKNVRIIEKKATEGIAVVVDHLTNKKW